jgi:hypothetical protein
MPALAPEILYAVFFLYRDAEDARAGKNAGGTGFLLATPTEDKRGHHYGITNWHVAVKHGYSCIRINTTAGAPEILAFGPEEWFFEPGKDDVAVIPLDLRRPGLLVYFIGSQVAVTEASAQEARIGPGDDVFMIGKFVDIESRETSTPALRFGNISTPPIPTIQPTGFDGASYCIDMHSRTGYSGSPVFIYRTPGSSLEWFVTGRPPDLGSSLCALLGIHWGQFPEELAIKRRKTRDRKSESLSERAYDEYIEGMSGMTCVIPAWRITALLAEARVRGLPNSSGNS